MALFLNSAETGDLRLRRLAERIKGLAGKDEIVLRHAHEIDALRRAAAAEIFATCAEFVASLNLLLEGTEVELNPTSFTGDGFNQEAANLIHMNVRGRILQVEFAVTEELVSTEDFRIPYTLEGFVRAFNQDLLDKSLIEEQLIFYTVEKRGNMWRFFDARTYRSGPFDQAYLVHLMEQLI